MEKLNKSGQCLFFIIGLNGKSGGFMLAAVYSFQFSHSVVSNSLWPHELQHTRPLCPSPTPGVHSDSRPSSRWCHSVISSSVVPFSSCPQSLSASESAEHSSNYIACRIIALFIYRGIFAWGGQSIGVSASISVLPMNNYPSIKN